MSDAGTSPYVNFGSDSQGNTGNGRSTSHKGNSPTDLHRETNMNSALYGQLHDDAPLDTEISDLMKRRLTKEIDEAKNELKSLETTLVYDLFSPTVREWLLPLMAIGLALSLYGSFSSSNSAELGATGMMLLWSLSAFWFIYTRDKRLEMAKRANKAEIEIWSSRIEELQESLERNKRVAEVTE